MKNQKRRAVVPTEGNDLTPTIKEAISPGIERTASSQSGRHLVRLIAGLVTAMSLLVPLAFLCGQKFRTGWLGGLGLVESLAPLDFNGYVRVGFESLYGILGLIINKTNGEDVWQLFTRTLIMIAVLIFGVFIYHRLPSRVRDRIEHAIESPSRGLKTSSAGFLISLSMILTGIFFFLTFILALVAAFVLIVPAIGAEAAGRAEARHTWLQVLGRSEKPRDYATFKLTDGESVRDAKLIECGDYWCIAFDGVHFVALNRDKIGPIIGAKVKFSAKP